VQLPVEQRDGIPHHLIDILPPDAEFSAGDFHHLGRRAAEDIIQVRDMSHARCGGQCVCLAAAAAAAAASLLSTLECLVAAAAAAAAGLPVLLCTDVHP
jgi:hypothetical protein